jgi:hypothetical protein
MRARNLKPGFFKNELLGSVDPLISILFAGLWGIADREGRLEDRPLRICAELFPYRRAVTETKVDAFLGWLHEHGFIVRYQLSGKSYIQINEFLKHQRPHSNETPSSIPGLSSNGGLPRSEALATMVESEAQPRCAPVSPLNPSSLNPESPFTESPHTGLRTKVGAPSAGRGGRVAQRKTREEREAEAKAKGIDVFALPGEPGYGGGSPPRRGGH